MLSGLARRGQDVFSALPENILETVKPGLTHVLFHEGLEQLLKQRWKKFYPILASWLVCFHPPAKRRGDWRGQLWTACVNCGPFPLLQAEALSGVLC